METNWHFFGKTARFKIAIKRRPYSMHRSYGLGLLIDGGSSGSTYGDPRNNMGLHIGLTLFAWTILLLICWKS